jgi:hypothetical protein
VVLEGVVVVKWPNAGMALAEAMMTENRAKRATENCKLDDDYLKMEATENAQ